MLVYANSTWRLYGCNKCRLRRSCVGNVRYSFYVAQCFLCAVCCNCGLRVRQRFIMYIAREKNKTCAFVSMCHSAKRRNKATLPLSAGSAPRLRTPPPALPGRIQVHQSPPVANFPQQRTCFPLRALGRRHRSSSMSQSLIHSRLRKTRMSTGVRYWTVSARVLWWLNCQTLACILKFVFTKGKNWSRIPFVDNKNPAMWYSTTLTPLTNFCAELERFAARRKLLFIV